MVAITKGTNARAEVQCARIVVVAGVAMDAAIQVQAADAVQQMNLRAREEGRGRAHTQDRDQEPGGGS